MKEESEFLALVFDNIRENIVVVDADNYAILHANQSFLGIVMAFPWKKVGKNVATR